MKKTNTVNEIDKMKTLTDREKAREKLPVFYGSRDNYLHGFREVINNSVDEVLNNFNSGKIDVVLHEDLKTITITDSGRGIPIQAFDEEGAPYFEIIFEKLFAGGKMEDTDLENTGVNGLGLCCLNYTSDIFEVEVCSQGFVYEIKYKNGGIEELPLTKKEKKDSHYTKITFRLDDTMYTNTIFTYEEIKDIVNKTAKVSPNLTLSLLYKDKLKTFNYPSLESYFEKYSTDNVIDYIVGTNKEYVEENGEKTSVEIVFSGSDGEDLLQECMLNGNNFILNSTISAGVYNGVRKFAHGYARDNKLYENKEKNINAKDVESTLNFVCNVFSNRPEFQGQTKFSTEKKLYEEVVSIYVQEILEVFSKERTKDCERLVNQILISKRAMEKSNKLIKDTKKKLTESVNNMHSRVEGLKDCKYHNEDSEFFITEGKSSMGSVVPSRNPNTQAAYGIRGKILNCLKANYETIFANKVVVDLIKIIGCGVEVQSKYNRELSNFNMDNLRYGKIALATDSDKDGEAIQVLLLTMFYRLMPQLIYEGKIYITKTPAYIVKNGDKKHYAFDEEEKDDLVSKLKGKVIVGYLKGLGEIDADDMYNTAMNPETRQMIKVTVGDIEKMVEKFETWMGNEVDERKQYIEENLHRYIDEQE